MVDEEKTIQEKQQENPEFDPIFTNCNVCGRKLHYEIECEMGLCLKCSEE